MTSGHQTDGPLHEGAGVEISSFNGQARSINRPIQSIRQLGDQVGNPWEWLGGGGARVGTPACLSTQVTNQSRVQGLFQGVGPMELGHVQGGGRGAGVAGSGVALAVDRGGGHVQGGRALLVVLAVTLLVQGQSQALPLLPPVAEPNSHHLRETSTSSSNPLKQDGSCFVLFFVFNLRLSPGPGRRRCV